MSTRCLSFCRYDFVVIGGGSAGATVAARLSEEPRFSVLLLEAGLDEPTGTQIPSFFFNFIGSDIDWQYTTESEDEACLNKEHKKCYWPRGKVCRIRWNKGTERRRRNLDVIIILLIFYQFFFL